MSAMVASDNLPSHALPESPMRPPVPVNLEWIGRTLLTIQAEIHSMRDENALD
jgi:hypothetical protein